MSNFHDHEPSEPPTTIEPVGEDREAPARRPWLGIEMRHLAALAAVAHEGSFRGAADSLGYVQSAISQQVARLERLVGTRLVERQRGASHVALTEPGALLLRHFNEILLRFDAAQADIEAIREGRAGVLSVGVYESVAARLMPAILRALATRAPGVDVRMAESRSADDLARRIENGQLDLAFGTLPSTAGAFAFSRLLEDPYVLLVPARSPLAEAAVSPQALAGLPLIGPSDDGSAVDVALRERGVAARYVFRSDSNTAIQALVAAGIGVAIVPRLTVEASDPQTQALPLDGLVPAREIGLYWHRERRRTPARDAFVDVAREAVEGKTLRAGRLETGTWSPAPVDGAREVDQTLEVGAQRRRLDPER